jgi:hypothetical protein
MVVEAFSSCRLPDGHHGDALALGRDSWMPEDDAERQLRDSLAESLCTDAVIDLVLFGSIARSSTTGYSDVDAILIVADDAALDDRRLRALRSRVLAAGRAVLAYQPMQHHGFLVATPSLLRNVSVALGLPAQALETTSSLLGNPTKAMFDRVDAAVTTRFHALARSLLQTNSWPAHPWYLHRTVAMFELAPTLYMQASGRPCAKHQSFDLAREEFPAEWHPYEVLYEVRRRWPREPRLALQLTASALRNPWAAVALWRRFPSAISSSVAGFLDEDSLTGLHRIVKLMAARIR